MRFYDDKNIANSNIDCSKAMKVILNVWEYFKSDICGIEYYILFFTNHGEYIVIAQFTESFRKYLLPCTNTKTSTK
jgi:hypothetical protein